MRVLRESTGTLGVWIGESDALQSAPEAIAHAIRRVGRPLFVVAADGEPAVTHAGQVRLGEMPADRGGLACEDEGGGLARDSEGARPLLAYVPALPPERLGEASFRQRYSLRYAYVGGAMAHGIASTAMVRALGQAGMLGFFGAAGLSLERIAAAIDEIQAAGDFPAGFNLIYNPAEPRHEAAVVELYLRRGVRLVSAAAYIDLSLPLVRYRVAGLRRGPDGAALAENRIIAKVSRVEVARRFFSPPPEAMVAELLRRGEITSEQAELASQVPMADDLTAEADSGGHTDNRPALALLPTMLALRDEYQRRWGPQRRIHIGAAGGIATPAAAAAAFALGAGYVLTGSINQACVESGTSPAVRRMLAEARQADVTMAPAADMFEMGVQVQVLKRGTMFAVRARKLFELYRACGSLDDIPPAERQKLETTVFRLPLDEVWQQTRAFFMQRDKAQIERAERDPKHRMALVFRWYLGQASHWAIAGDPQRVMDYQVWCGPAMGAFNEWVRGTWLEQPEARDVVTVGRNLLTGAAALTRAGWLAAGGLTLPAEARAFVPLTIAELDELEQASEPVERGHTAVAAAGRQVESA